MRYLSALLACLALQAPPLHAADAQPATPRAGAAATPASASRPGSQGDEDARCTALRERYQESLACYSPFVNANGSVKPEAYERCGPPVPEPVAECSSTPAH